MCEGATGWSRRVVEDTYEKVCRVQGEFNPQQFAFSLDIQSSR